MKINIYIMADRCEGECNRVLKHVKRRNKTLCNRCYNSQWRKDIKNGSGKNSNAERRILELEQQVERLKKEKKNLQQANRRRGKGDNQPKKPIADSNSSRRHKRLFADIDEQVGEILARYGVDDGGVHSIAVRDGAGVLHMSQGDATDNELRDVVGILDGGVSRDNHRRYANEYPAIAREYQVSKKRLDVNDYLDTIIPIKSEQLTTTAPLPTIPLCSAVHSLDALALAMATKLETSLPDAGLLRNLLPSLIEKLSAKVTIVLHGDGHPARRRHGQSQMAIHAIFENDPEDANNPKKYIPLFVYDGEEDTELLRQAWELAEGQELLDFVDGTDLLDVYFCSDWKFEAKFFDRCGPISNDFCIHCRCCLRRKTDWTTTEWTMVEDELHGSKNPIAVFPPSRILVDTFHCWLRISQKLFKLLVREWESRAELQGKTKAEEEIRFLLEMRKCRISGFRFFVQDGVRKWTSLDGGDCLKFFSKFDVKSVFSPRKAEKLRSLYDGWLDIAARMRSQSTCQRAEQFQLAVRQWLELFLFSEVNCEVGLWEDGNYAREHVTMYTMVDMTPYMHKLLWHVPQFFGKGIVLGLYSCDTFELTNRLHRRVVEKGKASADKTRIVMEWCFRQVEDTFRRSDERPHVQRYHARKV